MKTALIFERDARMRIALNRILYGLISTIERTEDEADRAHAGGPAQHFNH
jgi:hypothetical protein